MQYTGQVNKIAAGSAVIIMNFEPKMGCGLHKTWVWLYPKWVWFKEVGNYAIVALLYRLHCTPCS